MGLYSWLLYLFFFSKQEKRKLYLCHSVNIRNRTIGVNSLCGCICCFFSSRLHGVYRLQITSLCLFSLIYLSTILSRRRSIVRSFLFCPSFSYSSRFSSLSSHLEWLHSLSLLALPFPLGCLLFSPSLVLILFRGCPSSLHCS